MSHHRQSIPKLNWDPDQIPALLSMLGHDEAGDCGGNDDDVIPGLVEAEVSLVLLIGMNCLLVYS